MAPSAGPEARGGVCTAHEHPAHQFYICWGDGMETFVQILKDFGFPVACVVALFWLLQKEQENHKQETANLTSAITELRVVLAKILAKIGGDDK